MARVGLSAVNYKRVSDVHCRYGSKAVAVAIRDLTGE